MAAVGEFANLAEPQIVGEACAALGQLHRHLRSAGQFDTMRTELFDRPILFGELVIGEDSDSLFEQFSEQFRTVGFPIKYQCEPMGAGIFVQPLFLLGPFWAPTAGARERRRS